MAAFGGAHGEPEEIGTRTLPMQTGGARDDWGYGLQRHAAGGLFRRCFRFGSDALVRDPLEDDPKEPPLAELAVKKWTVFDGWRPRAKTPGTDRHQVRAACDERFGWAARRVPAAKKNTPWRLADCGNGSFFAIKGPQHLPRS